MYGMGGFGSGGFGRGPGFDQAVGNHFSGMMQGGNSYGGGMGYGEPPQPDGGPMFNDHMMRNKFGMPGPRQMPAYGGPTPMEGGLPGGMDMDMMRLKSGMPFGYGYREARGGNPMPMPPPGYHRGGMYGGPMPQPGGMPEPNPRFFGGGFPMPSPMPRPMPMPGYGFTPSPDGGSIPNPDNMGRQFANGDPFRNARGNLRMRFRDPDPSTFYQSGGF